MDQNLQNVKNISNQCCLPPYLRTVNDSVNYVPIDANIMGNNTGTQASISPIISRDEEINLIDHRDQSLDMVSTSSTHLRNSSERVKKDKISSFTTISRDSLKSVSYNRIERSKCCGQGNNSKVKKVSDKASNCGISIQKNKVDCSCGKWTDLSDPKDVLCKKYVSCTREIGANACRSAFCIVNKSQECPCRYPPSFKQFGCIGKLTGNCNCNRITPKIIMQFNTDIHDALSPISWLAGRWVTEDGRGHFPNLNDFQYHEELEFICIGQPMFNFTSTSRHPEKKTPMHQERGFLRIKPGSNDLAFMVSHNFGLTSLEEGQCNPEKKEISLTTVNLARTSFSKPPYVKSFKRDIKLLQPDTLEVTMYMETDTTPLSEHLKAIYKRV